MYHFFIIFHRLVIVCKKKRGLPGGGGGGEGGGVGGTWKFAFFCRTVNNFSKFRIIVIILAHRCFHRCFIISHRFMLRFVFIF